MRTLKYSARGFSSRLASFCALSEPPIEVRESVRRIVSTVRQDGDVALIRWTKKFDGVRVSTGRLRVGPDEVSTAVAEMAVDTLEAIQEAVACVKEFHLHDRPESWVASNPHGARVGESYYPIDRVGIYIPGGVVPLVSTVVMTVTLARLAGVPEVVVCTPPESDCSIDPALLSALKCCGVDEIYRVGGAQAIAAMALGTNSIRSVCKIFGPGNIYVNEAKRQLFGQVGIDLLAGPSEVMIIADRAARPDYVAADLLAQAEHGPRGRMMLVSTAEPLVAQVRHELRAQLAQLPRAREIQGALKEGCLAVLVTDLAQAVEVANYVAPEHLELHLPVVEARGLAEKIRNAGAIFVGADTPTVLGDFTAGPSHTLPTGRSARFFSGLRVSDFLRRSSIVCYDRKSLAKALPVVEVFSRLEQLEAHARSLRVRMGRFVGKTEKDRHEGSTPDCSRSFALPHIQDLTPYVPGQQPTGAGWIKLNTNENPYPPGPTVAQAVSSEVERLGLYPEPRSESLRQSIAASHSIPSDMVIVGNGSDEILNLLVRVFCGPDRTVGMLDPDYSLYPVLVAIHNEQLVRVPLAREMNLIPDAVIGSATNLFFISSPHAPTSVGFSPAAIASILEIYSGVVVVDEAYAAFADVDAVGLLKDHRNLVVSRTFSKSHALAGLRVGYALADPGIIDLLDRVRDSYNVGRLGQAGALAALEDREYFESVIARVRSVREWFWQQLQEWGWFTYPPQANFVFTEPVSGSGATGEAVAAELFSFLQDHRILVRYFPGSPLTERFLRISVGTIEQMEKLIETIDLWRKKG